MSDELEEVFGHLWEAIGTVLVWGFTIIAAGIMVIHRQELLTHWQLTLASMAMAILGWRTIPYPYRNRIAQEILERYGWYKAIAYKERIWRTLGW
jgi:hypothetical protein